MTTRVDSRHYLFRYAEPIPEYKFKKKKKIVIDITFVHKGLHIFLQVPKIRKETINYWSMSKVTWLGKDILDQNESRLPFVESSDCSVIYMYFVAVDINSFCLKSAFIWVGFNHKFVKQNALILLGGGGVIKKYYNCLQYRGARYYRYIGILQYFPRRYYIAISTLDIDIWRYIWFIRKSCLNPYLNCSKSIWTMSTQCNHRIRN